MRMSRAVLSPATASRREPDIGAAFAAGRPWQRGMRMPDVPSDTPVRGGAPVYGSTAITSISSLALGGMRPATTVVVASGRKYRSNTSWTPSKSPA